MPYVILDRDGVINIDIPGRYITSPAEWEPIPGSLAAIANLNAHGFKVFIATNQSGIAQGLYTLETLENIHKKLVHLLHQEGGKIEEIFFCPHHANAKCSCRKPRPGLIDQIAKKYSIDFSQTYFIGDSLVDIQAAQAAGCRPILVLTGQGQGMIRRHPILNTILHFVNLAAAVKHIVEHPLHADSSTS